MLILILCRVFLFFFRPTQLIAEEYVTLDDFEEDLKLMALEAKEVRDRLKADLANAEARARDFSLAEGVLPEDGEAAASAANVASGPMCAGGGGGGGAARSDAGRRALMDVDRITGQLGRAAAAVDMAYFLRDAALSFLQE